MQQLAIILAVLLSLASLPAVAELTAEEKSLAYDEALVLGQCAGLLKFTSILLEAQDKPFQAKDASQKSNGWRIATMGALYTAGWRGERIAITADSIFEGALTQWLGKLESGSPTIVSEMEKEVSACLSHNESQEDFRKLYKMIINQNRAQ